jgi:hypothetical protein
MLSYVKEVELRKEVLKFCLKVKLQLLNTGLTKRTPDLRLTDFFALYALNWSFSV